jgi:DNA-binding response OmpR family regulator
MMEQGDDGIVMAQQLRRKGFSTPILLLTGISRVMARQFDKNAEVIPVDAFLEKPIAPRRLIAKVKELLAAQEGTHHVRNRT